MRHSAGRHERRRGTPGLIGSVAAASGTAIIENPVLVGSSTAFLVVLFYVSANALWYQPFPHPEPFLETRFTVERATQPAVPEAVKVRPVSRPDITNSVPPVRDTAPPVVAPDVPFDDAVARVQAALSELGLYTGSIDGLTGPQTRRAITDYEKTLGLPETGEISRRLLTELDVAIEERGAATPPVLEDVPVPRPRRDGLSSAPLESGLSTEADRYIVKIQAGLRAFGNESIEIDGVMGEKTRSAIREFQSLFGLPVTGEADEVVLTKMTEIGLTN